MSPNRAPPGIVQPVFATAAHGRRGRNVGGLLPAFGAIALGLMACGGGDDRPPPAGMQLPPAAPSGLAVLPLGGGALLTWRDNARNEQGFEVERSSGGEFRRLAWVEFDVVQYQDAELAPGRTYAYRVRAIGTGGPSSYSNEVTWTAVGGDAGPGTADAAADAPTGDIPNAGDVGTGATVSFRRDIVPLLVRSCGANAPGCHARFAYSADRRNGCRGWLSLEDRPLGSIDPITERSTGCPDLPLYERLTRHTAWLCNPERRYVTPASPTESQIYSVVSGNPGGSGACNVDPGVPLGPMPPPESDFTISADGVRLLEAWIRAGAPDN